MIKSHIVGIHHIGIVVEDIITASEKYMRIFGYKPESDVVEETSQKVLVRFFSFHDYHFELIQPLGKDSPVSSFLARKGKINHVCYLSDNLDESILYFRKEYGAILTSGPEQSRSVENCIFAFLAKPDGEVIELVQIQDD